MVGRVVVVGGGAAGTLVAVHLLRRGGPGLEVVVVEPRESLGLGVAFGTTDPWHRLNVPAITMSGLPEDLDHFRRWADVPADSFPSRSVYGRYLQALLAESVAGSAGTLQHVRSRATGIGETGGRLVVTLEDGEAASGEAVVVATGNELPSVPAFLQGVLTAGDTRFVRDPWAGGALDAVADGETDLIIGTGHTALDLAATLLRGREGVRVVALSRHGELPRAHEDPWRPRPPVPAFGVEELRAFGDPLAEGREVLRRYPGGWRQGLDSLRPIMSPLWLALDDDARRRFVRDWRREWEIHRSRISAGVARDVRAWRDAGVLEISAARIERVVAEGAGLRVEAAEGEWLADHVLLATGPNEDPGASPLLATLMAAGLARPGPMGLGLDVDPATLRVIDASGAAGRPLYALGPLLRGAIWETIAVPEIRGQAAGIAERVLAGV